MSPRTPKPPQNRWFFMRMHNMSVVKLSHLGSLPLNSLFRVRVFRCSDGLLLRWKGWIREQHAGLQTLCLESFKVLVLELDRVLSGAQRSLVVGRHRVSGRAVRKMLSDAKCESLNTVKEKAHTHRIRRGLLERLPGSAQPGKVCGAPGGPSVRESE